MNWPDNWTKYRADGTELADGPRYRLIGNGVVSAVSAWIGERLFRVISPAPVLPEPGREGQ